MFEKAIIVVFCVAMGALALAPLLTDVWKRFQIRIRKEQTDG